MKKLFTLTIMLITLAMNAQEHVSNPVVDVAIFKGTEAYGIENALTVPEGTFLTFKENIGNYWRWAYPDGSSPSNFEIEEDRTTLPEGFKFYSNLVY